MVGRVEGGSKKKLSKSAYRRQQAKTKAKAVGDVRLLASWCYSSVNKFEASVTPSDKDLSATAPPVTTTQDVSDLPMNSERRRPRAADFIDTEDDSMDVQVELDSELLDNDEFRAIF